MGPIVVAAYRPRPNRGESAVELVCEHVAALRSLGFLSKREPVVMCALDGTVIEIIEWASRGANREAHLSVTIQNTLDGLASACECVPIALIREAADMYSEFTSADTSRPAVIDRHGEALYEYSAAPGSVLSAYFEAVRANNVALVRTILGKHPTLVHARIADLYVEPWTSAELDARQSNTALHWVAAPLGQQGQAHVELAQALIEHGADANAMGYNENKGVAPAVVLAAWEGELDILRILLEHGADPNRPGQVESALYCALEHTAKGAVAPNKVSVLLDYGAEHDIFTAAMMGRVDLVETFIDEYSPLIDRRSLKRNRTPVEEATNYEQWEVARYLISRGAAVSAHVLAAMGDVGSLEVMLETEPSLLEAKDDSGQTPLFAAVCHSRTEAVLVLLGKGADPCVSDRWFVTALHVAVKNGNPEVLESLLDAGADPTAINHAGKTAFDFVAAEDEEVINIFKRYHIRGLDSE